MTAYADKTTFGKFCQCIGMLVGKSHHYPEWGHADKRDPYFHSPEIEWWKLDGKWNDEPTFLFSAKHQAVIQRNPKLGMLCGYVKVPKSHPLHRVIDPEAENLNVHWGATFAEDYIPFSDFTTHKAGVEDDPWWIGFDCAHSGDLVPGLSMQRGVSANDTYRDIEFVKKEIKKLRSSLRRNYLWFALKRLCGKYNVAKRSEAKL